MQSRLLSSPHLLEQMLEILPVGVWILDRTGNIVYGNPAGRAIWAGAKYIGVEQFGEYVGWWRHNGKRIEANEWAAARAITSGETSVNEEIEIQCFDGSRKVIHNSALPIRDEEGEIVGGIIVNVDISDHVRLESKLKELADTDPLTRACTRRRFHELLTDELGRAQRYGHNFSLIMFDLDHFKAINDSHGHVVGDEVLAAVSERVRAHIRSTDHVSRYGGDEFIILLPETQLREARLLAEKLREVLLEEPLSVPGEVSCSFGVYQYRAGDTTEELLRKVDRALYRAKAQGRNCVECVD